jgi:hypothetical protein
MSDAQEPQGTQDPIEAENHEVTAAEAEEKNIDPVDATTEADVSDGREQKQAPVEGS